MRDWNDKIVRTTYELNTRGGVVIPKGTLAIVGAVWRNKVSLFAAEKKPDGTWGYKYKNNNCIDCLIRHVSIHDVQAVDGDTPEPPKQRTEAIHFRLGYNRQEGEYLLALLKEKANIHAERLRERIEKTLEIRQ